MGIALQAVHATQDLPYPSVLEDCRLENVVIYGNDIVNARIAVRVYAAHLEGRNDPFWGFKLEKFSRETPFSTRCERASVAGISIHQNKIVEYDQAFVLGAAWGAGHSYIHGSRIGNDIRVFGNELDPGRKIFCYEKQLVDEVMYDDAQGFDNYVVKM